MNVSDFLTQDELDDLPEDPRQAFVEFVYLARQRLDDWIGNLNGEYDGQAIEDARYSFMNVVMGAAKKFQIEQLASMEVPRIHLFDLDVHRQFIADLDNYITQLRLDETSRRKRESVHLDSKAKDRIRGHIHALRICIGNADLPDPKKTALFNRLANFEAELDKKRISILAVSVVAMGILAVPGDLADAYDASARLVTKILQVIGEAKAVEDELRKLPPITPPALLTGPRQNNPGPPSSGRDEDEVPF